jgi:hypothetical protein
MPTGHNEIGVSFGGLTNRRRKEHRENLKPASIEFDDTVVSSMVRNISKTGALPDTYGSMTLPVMSHWNCCWMARVNMAEL